VSFAGTGAGAAPDDPTGTGSTTSASARSGPALVGGRNPGVVAQRALRGWREPELRADRGASLPQPLQRLERGNGVAEFVQQIVAVFGVDIREKDFELDGQAGVDPQLACISGMVEKVGILSDLPHDSAHALVALSDARDGVRG
jgi:hypothetical protein